MSYINSLIQCQLYFLQNLIFGYSNNEARKNSSSLDYSMKHNNVYHYICILTSKLALKFLDYVNIAEYGRWDDYVWLWNKVKDKDVKNMLAITLSAIINIDLEAMSRGENISLCAKWLPSISTSSKETRRIANKLAKEVFRFSPRQYRPVQRTRLYAYRGMGSVSAYIPCAGFSITPIRRCLDLFHYRNKVFQEL